MKSNDTMRIEYVSGDNYSPEYINGAYGGRNTKGEIVINFYCERISVPEVEEYKINSNGTAERKYRDESEKSPIVRNITHGVIMNDETAKEILSWLSHIVG